MTHSCDFNLAMFLECLTAAYLSIVIKFRGLQSWDKSLHQNFSTFPLTLLIFH